MTESLQNKSAAAASAKSFAAMVAQYVYENHGSAMQDVQLILPGSGAIPSLVEAFREAAAGKALVLPGMKGIDSLMDQHSSLKRISPLKALIILFEAFRKHHHAEESLASFFSLGQVLLADFDLILRASRTPEQVFAGMHRWEATGAGFADFMDEDQKSLMRNFSLLFRDNANESRSRFLRLWENMPAIFREFENNLLKDKTGTPAMVYRDAAQQLSKNSGTADVFYYFIGFSGLSGLEIQLMQHLAGLGRAGFIWDILPDYAESPVHEVNRVFSRLRRIPEFQSSLDYWTSRCKRTELPQIKEVVCPGLAGMAQWILSEPLPPEDSTAFIISDPAMMQLLTGKGRLANGLNLRFSMGYPLGYTPFARWMTKILQWISRPVPEQCKAYLPIQEDPVFFYFFPEAARHSQILFSAMQIPSLAELKELEGLPDWFFLTEPGAWLASFSSWLNGLDEIPGKDWLQASVIKAQEILVLLKEVAELAGQEFGFSVLQSCLHSAFQAAEIRLVKEDGPEWKAIGLFESLNLDFDRIVIAPADEGLFPSGGKSQSLLPDSVRRAFSLPLRQQETEEQAYHFYRLCHRSKELIFLSSAGEGKRRSRFLDQVEFGGIFSYTREILQFSSGMKLSPVIRIQRDSDEMERAQAYRLSDKADVALKKLSPSSLHALITCPLRFHYQKIAGLKEPEKVSGLQMSAEDYGNWVHTAIQLLLEKIAGHRRIIKREEYDEMEEVWDTFSGQVWDKLEGRNTPGPLEDYPVEKALGKIMAGRFFRFMKEHKPHRWLDNEYRIPEIKIGEPGSWFTITGRADIIMEEDDCFRLLDLKTGAFRDADKMLLQMEDNGLPSEAKIIAEKDYFQMICYNRLGSEDPRFGGKPVRASLFYLARPQPELADPFRKVTDREMEAAVFAGLDTLLLQHLNRLTDPKMPVNQAGDSAVCVYCSFNAICRRT